MKKVIVLGGGESGVGAALLANKNGFEVFVSDKGEIKDYFKKQLIENNIAFEENKHTEEIILNASIVIRSPGISKKAEIINKINKNNIELISEIEWGCRFTKAKIIAITGSNGKTTTTSLIYHILHKAGYHVGVGGNIGNSFSKIILDTDYDFLIIEVSSFQLENIKSFKPFISIILNITPDHLDEYDFDFEKYAKTKYRIIENQTQENYFVYNFDDQTITNLINSTDSAVQKIGFSIKKELKKETFATESKIMINFPQPLEIPINIIPLIGNHNIYNTMAAATALNILKIKNNEIREGLSTFEAVEHRLEEVKTINGIHFINDSKATNINSTYYALEGMKSKTIWIVGGIDKGNDYSELYQLVKRKVKAIICLGLDNSKIIDAFKDKIELIIETDNMQDAVSKAYELGENGDTVLLSPACSSFDLFKNYEDRGTKFKEIVKEIV